MSITLPAAVYVLCFVTSGLCAILLGRGYARSRARLLMWAAACFVFLAANNLMVVVDLVILPEADFRVARLAVMLAAVSRSGVGVGGGGHEVSELLLPRPTDRKARRSPLAKRSEESDAARLGVALEAPQGDSAPEHSDGGESHARGN